MTCIHECSDAMQNALLVASMLNITVLVGVIMVAFARGAQIIKKVILCAVLMFDAAIYVVMQLECASMENLYRYELHLPYAVFAGITLLSLLYTACVLYAEIFNRKSVDQNSIKEAFDNLPSGVCFFNEAGLPVLCNSEMHRFCFEVSGKTVQYVNDLEACLWSTVSETVKRENNIFIFCDGKVRQLEKRSITGEQGEKYTQYIAIDVTELVKSRAELRRDNEELKQMRERLQELSSGVIALTREEEILAMKMRVHDEMGRCLIAARAYLAETRTEPIPQNVINSWQRAVKLLRSNTEEQPHSDMLAELREVCSGMNLNIITQGELPDNEKIAYLLVTAIRECSTNAVRYGKATELYASFSADNGSYSVTVTNNGIPPQEEVVEGSGLSSLRKRVERAGGTMRVQALPRFSLTVTLQSYKEEGLL